MPDLARPVPVGAVPDLVERVRLLLAAAPAATAVPALVVRERVVVVGAAVLALGFARLMAGPPRLLLPELLPLVREGDSSEVAAA